MSNFKIRSPASLDARRTKEYRPLTLGASAQGLSCHADGEDFGGISFAFGGCVFWAYFWGGFFLYRTETDMGDMGVSAKSEVDVRSEDRGLNKGGLVSLTDRSCIFI